MISVYNLKITALHNFKLLNMGLFHRIMLLQSSIQGQEFLLYSHLSVSAKSRTWRICPLDSLVNTEICVHSIPVYAGISKTRMLAIGCTKTIKNGRLTIICRRRARKQVKVVSCRQTQRRLLAFNVDDGGDVG